MRIRFVPVLALALLVTGCKFGQYPNPNEPKTGQLYDGATLQKTVRQVDEMLNQRVMKGQIDQEQKRAIFQQYITKQLAEVDVDEIPTDQAWRFADVYRQIDDWQTTRNLYIVAVKNAADEDRRVNDTLRLAESEARLDNVVTGIDLIRSTFNVDNEGKAPILMATLYEFVPAALDKGHDIEVIKLLEEATEQHLLTVVDPESGPGKAFIQSRFHHLREAWTTIIRTYRANEDIEEMRGAIERSDEMMRRFATA